MERDKVIKLVNSQGIYIVRDSDTVVCGLAQLLELVALVEKETLERAAKKCEDIAFMMGGSVGAMDCAISIRNLKGNR